MDGGTLITFKHSAIGMFPEDMKSGATSGWAYSHERVRKAAERAARV